MAEAKIVRIIDKDIDGNLPLYRALTSIKGVSLRYNLVIAKVFEKHKKKPYDVAVADLNEEEIAFLENLMRNPADYNIPKWMLNKASDIWTGEAKHLLASDLIFNAKLELDRLSKIKHRRAIRRIRGLPVRGQKTKAGFRKGRTVGVVKKKK